MLYLWRKHIHTCYDLSEVGEFLEHFNLVNYKAGIDIYEFNMIDDAKI